MVLVITLFCLQSRILLGPDQIPIFLHVHVLYSSITAPLILLPKSILLVFNELQAIVSVGDSHHRLIRGWANFNLTARFYSLIWPAQ